MRLHRHFRPALLCALAFAAAPATSYAGPITVTTVTSSQALMETFAALPGAATAVFDGNGLTAAESFVGLTVVDPGGGTPEFYTGSPTGPLSLNIGAATTGLLQTSGGAAGLAGGTAANDIGEGVVAVLFDYDILELGLKVLGSGGGPALFRFYAGDGSLVDSIFMATANTDYTFSSLLAVRGVAIENTDDAGIAYDDFRFASAPAAVPEPASLLLLGSGIAALARRRLRRRG
jgi:hypothetical protein